MTIILPMANEKSISDAFRQCDNGNVVYFAKNGRSRYAMMNLEAYERMEATSQLMAELFKGIESIRAERPLSIEETFAGLEG